MKPAVSVNPGEVGFARHGIAGIVTFFHPPAHLWTIRSLRRFGHVVQEVQRDKSLRVLILTGEGTTFFSAGADLGALPRAGRSEVSELIEGRDEALATLDAFPGIKIAAINGCAMGIGLRFALACDIRLCESHAELGLAEAGLGQLPDTNVHDVIPPRGAEWAHRLLLCGERLDASAARRLGVVDRVGPRGTSLDAALDLVGTATSDPLRNFDTEKNFCHGFRG